MRARLEELKMDPISAIKTGARLLQDASGPLVPFAIRRGQALELTVALLSSAHSWNEFAARPRTPCAPTTVEQYCAAITGTARRLLQLNVAPLLTRELRSGAVMTLMSRLTGIPALKHLWSVLDQEGISADLSKPFAHQNWPSERMAYWVRHRWRNQSPPWQTTERVATEMGFSPYEARLIRDIQREAVEQSYHLALWFEVGVLEPDPRAFLSEIRQQPDWEHSFADIYHSVGRRIPDDHERYPNFWGAGYPPE
jgi:hypothetical protein